MKEIKIIEVRSEIGAGTRGSSEGVDALKEVAQNIQSDFFTRLESVEITDENALIQTPVTTPNARWIEGIYRMYPRISACVCQVLLENN